MRREHEFLISKVGCNELLAPLDLILQLEDVDLKEADLETDVVILLGFGLALCSF